MAAMDNPWSRLPTSRPFVLDEDRDAVARFNVSADERVRIHDELLPEPFLGRPEAPVVLLGLNPGFSEEDLRWHRDASFVGASRRNLVHAHLEYPFYLLDPAHESPGLRWWSRKLAALIVATNRPTVAHAILCVEYFPYHSSRFRHRKLSLSSQRYSFALVEAAIARKALVVLMRGERIWFGAVPALASYERLLRLRNVQNPTVTRNNLPDGYDGVLAAMATVSVPIRAPNGRR
jgi:hypothetical protein